MDKKKTLSTVDSDLISDATRDANDAAFSGFDFYINAQLKEVNAIIDGAKALGVAPNAPLKTAQKAYREGARDLALPKDGITPEQAAQDAKDYQAISTGYTVYKKLNKAASQQAIMHVVTGQWLARQIKEKKTDRVSLSDKRVYQLWKDLTPQEEPALTPEDRQQVAEFARALSLFKMPPTAIANDRTAKKRYTAAVRYLTESIKAAKTPEDRVAHEAELKYVEHLYRNVIPEFCKWRNEALMTQSLVNAAVELSKLEDPAAKGLLALRAEMRNRRLPVTEEFAKLYASYPQALKVIVAQAEVRKTAMANQAVSQANVEAEARQLATAWQLFFISAETGLNTARINYGWVRQVHGQKDHDFIDRNFALLQDRYAGRIPENIVSRARELFKGYEIDLTKVVNPANSEVKLEPEILPPVPAGILMAKSSRQSPMSGAEAGLSPMRVVSAPAASLSQVLRLAPKTEIASVPAVAVPAPQEARRGFLGLFRNAAKAQTDPQDKGHLGWFEINGFKKAKPAQSWDDKASRLHGPEIRGPVVFENKWRPSFRLQIGIGAASILALLAVGHALLDRKSAPQDLGTARALPAVMQVAANSNSNAAQQFAGAAQQLGAVQKPVVQQAAAQSAPLIVEHATTGKNIWKLNLHTSPCNAAHIGAVMSAGVSYKVVGENKDWVQVETPHGFHFWGYRPLMRLTK